MIDAIPPGWLTANQLARKARLSIAETKRRLKAAGVPMRRYSINIGQGVIPVKHYLLK